MFTEFVFYFWTFNTGHSLNFSFFCSYTREQEIRWKWIFGPCFLSHFYVFYLKNIFKKCFELRNQPACPTCEKLRNHTPPSKKEHLISGMWSLSHLIKGRLATHAGQRNRTAHSIAGEQWPETAPYPETECFRNMLPLIFKTEKQVLSRSLFSPLPFPFSLHVLVCSQMLTSPCQMEICRGHSGGAQRSSHTQTSRPGGSLSPLQLGTPCLYCLSWHGSPPPPSSGVASRPSSHPLSIRCVYFFPDSRHIWSTYSGYSSATRHIPQDHFSRCYDDRPPSSDFQVAWQK